MAGAFNSGSRVVELTRSIASRHPVGKSVCGQEDDDPYELRAVPVGSAEYPIDQGPLKNKPGG